MVGRLVQEWFEVDWPEPGVITITEPLHEEQVKSYLAIGSDAAALIDTGMGVGDIRRLVAELTNLPLTVIQSHAHWDHIGGTASFIDQADIWIHESEADGLAAGISSDRMATFLAPERRRGTFPAWVHPERCPIAPVTPTRLLLGGETLDLGDRALEIIHAPGHSPGGVVLLDRSSGMLFSTDVAYAGPLYGQLAGSDLSAYRETLDRLADLAPQLRVVYPSHGPSPIDPDILPRMARAMTAVTGGRLPDDASGAVSSHAFGDFSILVRSEGEGPA